MLYAVTIDPLNAIFFVGERPEGNRWKVQEGVEIDIPINLADWPEGEESPVQVLCTAVSDPNHYRMFKNRRDIDFSEFQPTGKHFGGIYSKTAWARFMKNLPTSLALQDIPDTERPGATDEAIDAIKRKG